MKSPNGEWKGGPGNRYYEIGYREKCGLVTNDKVKYTTHSFRHYLVNRSKQERSWDYDIWCEITGHSNGKKTVREVSYEEDFDFDLKIKEMKMDFLDIKSIKKWI